MPNASGYKALLIRQDTRDEIDEVKVLYEEQLGTVLNYSQFLSIMCKKLKSDLTFSEKNHD
jgi:hypothetical protein